MLTISAPTKALVGSKYCASVTGFAGNLSARALINGVVYPVEISTHGSVAVVCVKIPDDAQFKGLQMEFVDSKGSEGSLSKLISK